MPIRVAPQADKHLAEQQVFMFVQHL